MTPIVAPRPTIRRLPSWTSVRTAVPWTSVLGWAGCVVVIAVMCLLLGADPVSMVGSMLDSSVLSPSALSQTLLRSIPIGLAALAVLVPARAGLVNVGGEGQLIIGAVTATGVGLAVGSTLPGALAIAVTVVAGAAAGAAWAAVCGLLKVWLDAPEAVTTLLMNLIANDLMLYLIYQPWKDPAGSGQPQSRMLADAVRFESWPGPLAVNTALVIAVLVALGIGFLMDRTTWGFMVKVAGSNRQAAVRHGLPTGRLMVSAMALGGALAGLGGALNLMGVEGQLRPGITTTFGYTAFMACFVSRYKPLRVIGIAIAFSAIALSGNGLQIDQGLDGNVVTVILGLIVLTYLLIGRRTQGATA